MRTDFRLMLGLSILESHGTHTFLKSLKTGSSVNTDIFMSRSFKDTHNKSHQTDNKLQTDAGTSLSMQCRDSDNTSLLSSAKTWNKLHTNQAQQADISKRRSCMSSMTIHFLWRLEALQLGATAICACKHSWNSLKICNAM